LTTGQAIAEAVSFAAGAAHWTITLGIATTAATATATVMMVSSHWTIAANLTFTVGSSSTVTVSDFTGAPRNC